MYQLRNLDDPRRRLLVRLLAAGAFSALPMGRLLADVLGEKPGKLPPVQRLYVFNPAVWSPDAIKQMMETYKR